MLEYLDIDRKAEMVLTDEHLLSKPWQLSERKLC